ncbi:type I polyketide synthase [Saccharomonospora xinjiangensis]|uniref:type I polyketide synthase n=1 Tax=Saccharomonospora xinjiangensis TaxID=75294 RepID=UPI00106F6740|nr:type I polyketide synthase [Saccharomonospora xinjiangensis]QBQ60371.1 Erythronolide synthase, modules 3 and 4 [Saccharomonospora xinjiangensis]
MDRNTTGENEPIAVIGLACRVPGAGTSERWWANLVSGVDSVGPPSEARRRAAVPAGPQIPSEGGFLDSVADFDADFFGISQREALAMDPQQRLALELAWEAMEDAGIVPAALTSLPVGVYLGSSSDDYALLLSRSGQAVSHHAMTGLQRGVIANRVSHHLGVRGPSLLIDTGQSSSLVAVHLAVASLRSGECRMAVAGGVNLALAPESQLAAARMGVLSPTGRCRVFDRAADGFVRGEGGGVVVLKPLSSALADGDRVYCVIRGTAVNHDGAGEDLAAPDGAAQAGLLASAHRAAGVTAADVQYVELHGTGTPAGDATEAAALREVFGDRDTALAVGSVKTSIGHLEGAAGVAGLIKTVLSVHHRVLPPNLHFTAPPDGIPLAEWGLRVQTETSPWPDPASPLIAGVSSFGIGGTNCHVVLAAHDSPEPPAEAGTTGPLPYVLSARTPAALAATARALREHRAARPDVRDVDVAFTLATGRTAHACRAVVVARDHADLLTGLDRLASHESSGATGFLGDAVVAGTVGSFGDLAERFLAGEEVNWEPVFAGRQVVRVALPTYPFERTTHWPAGLGAPPAESQAQPRTAPPVSEHTTATHAGERDAALPLDDVLDLAARVLGAAVLPDVPFSEQGFDSMMGLELRDLVEEHTGADVSVSLLYDHPTPAALAEHLAELTGSAAAPALKPRATAVAVPPAEPGPEGGFDTDPVVIVGMGCRYPGGVTTPEALWRLVRDRVDAITEPPAERGWHTLDTTGLRPGGFLDGIDRFDAEFFGISPREAAAMDPQQRIFLEVVWEALENAGIVPGTLRGSRTAVFAGATAQDYGARLHEQADSAGGFLLTGGTPSVLSGRVAYVLGLSGPALTVDTACSSSLSAVHLACRSLRTGESSLAIAGGVTVMALPGMFTEFDRQNGLSPDGRCRAFSADAAGTGWAEGAGVLVLERASDARRNGHRILAVVRGSALNSDGASNGLTAPSGLAQRQVIADALADAGLRPADIDAVEAHGTGTTLGDPIEATALLAAYGEGRQPDRPLRLGSVKSNIGHTQAAAGVAGVIKMVAALHHGELPATLHAEQPSPHVAWSAGTVALLTEPVPWPRTTRPRRAGVSSFGISGTNAHVIIEEAPHVVDEPVRDIGDRPVVLAVSARTEPALRAQAARLRDHLSGDHGSGDWSPADVAHSLLTTRTRFPVRAAVTGTTRQELLRGVSAIADGGADPAVVSGNATAAHRPVFVFGGQGGQWAGMARDLLDASPGFAEAIADCERALSPHVEWSLTGVLREAPGEPGLDRVDVVQPVLFATMIALARLWRAHGVEPSAVIGHSQGEIAAACVAGALSLDDAALVVARRSRALTALAGRGAMASIGLPADRVRGLLSGMDGAGGAVSIAACNGPNATTVSGDPAEVAALVERCTADGIRAKAVAVDYASHSAQVTELRERLLADLAPIRPGVPSIPMMSTVDVEKVDDAVLDAHYWYRNLRQEVRFDDAVTALVGEGHRTFVEVSPHPVLLSGIAERADELGEPVVTLESLTRGEGGLERFLRSLAKADAHGVPIDFSAAFPGRVVPLPTYAFQRDSHWLTVPAGTGDLTAAGLTAASHPFLGAEVEHADGGDVLLTGSLSLGGAAWLADHAVLDTVVLPGTACLDLVAWVGRRLGCPEVRELVLDSPVVVPDEAALRVQVVASAPDGDGSRTITLHTRQDGDATGWVCHATASVEPGERPVGAALESHWPPPDATEVPLTGHYERLRAIGLDYGPVFRGLRGAWAEGDRLWLDVALPEGGEGDFGLHPALLDAALHGIWLRPGDDGTCRLPFSFGGVRLSTTSATRLRVRLDTVDDSTVSLLAWAEDGTPAVAVDHLALRPVSPEKLTAAPALFSLSWADVAAEGDSGAEPVDADPVVLTDGLPARPPEVAVLECPAGDDPARAARQVLDVVRSVAGDERTVASRLVVATTGGDGELSDPAHAAVWGLVRSAQTEHPGRFVLLDTDRADSAVVTGALATGEAQVRFRGGRFATPVLRRASRPTRHALPRLGGTALITGGTGELGGLIARALVTTYGVRRVVLLSRRGPDAPGAAELVGDLTALGAEAQAVAGDAADSAVLDRVLAGLPSDRPLTTVVHAAGVLADAPVSMMDDAALDTVLRPKAAAALALHEATRNLPTVAAFVLFSSVAGILGTAGQANYAAANGVLDALARRRRAEGLPATSIAWGLWSQRSGLTGALDDTAVRRLAALGIGQLGTDDGLRLFDAALREPSPVVVAAALLGKGRSGLLRGLAPARPHRSAQREPSRTVIDELPALPARQRAARVLELVLDHTAAALGHSSSGALDTSASFKDLGCDSLIAVEIRNRLATATGLTLPATVVFSHPTPAELAGWLLDRLVPGPRPAEDDRDAGHAETGAVGKSTVVGQSAAPATAAVNRLAATSAAVPAVPAVPAAAPAVDVAPATPAVSGVSGDGTDDPDLDRELAEADVTELFALIDADPDDEWAAVSGGEGADGR